MQYYMNTNKIDIIVIFISSLPLNSKYHMALCDSGYFDKLSCNDDNFINCIQVERKYNW